MKKFVCTVCGYIHEGETAPEVCPVCKVGADKFEEMKGEMVWADEHRIGAAQGVDEEVLEGLRANFVGECTEVGMYLAMRLLGEVVVADTKANLKARVEAEYGATEGKLKIAKKAKELGLDAIHDTVHEMCKDEARHGKAFLGLLERHFGKQA